MIIPSFGLTATERVLPRLALDFTTAVLDSRVTFTRATSALNPATYTNSSGVITAAANNEPRFDYDPVTLVCKGLLIEESRTNALLNSDTLSTQIVTVTAAVRTLSFYGTGQIVLSGTASATINGSGAYPTRTTYTFTPTAGSLTLTVTGTVQYAQLEIGAFATSYIPTTIAALTRNADVATMTGTNFSDWFDATEGTFVIDASTFNTASASRVLIDVTNGTTSERIQLYLASGTAGTPIIFIADGGSTQAQLGTRTISSNTTFGFSAAYKLNNIASSVNAQAAQTDTTATLPTVNRASLFCRFDNTLQLNGYARALYYYPQRLINAELQSTSKI